MSKTLVSQIGILYEDDSCAVLDKPAGLMVHPDGRSEGPFLTDWLLERYPGLVGVGEAQKTPDGEDIVRPGIVHRLDRETSGAILIAKTPEAHSFFKAQFQARTVSKKYLAFVWGEMREKFGTIDRAIGRSAKQFTRWSAQRGARGEMRDAETYWSRLWTGPTLVAGKTEKFSLILAEPKTGRTHQIRVHMASIQHPVAGDPVYGPHNCITKLHGQCLHAKTLGFIHPITGEHLRFDSELPEYFTHFIASLRRGIV